MGAGVLALNPEEDELFQKTAELAALLERTTDQEATIMGTAGESVDLPTQIFEVLQNVVNELKRGNGVVIMPVNKLLTTNQAADILNVSRPFLVGLLKAKKIPFESVGSHRRIRLQDLLVYKELQARDREEALADMVRRSDDAGLPY